MNSTNVRDLLTIPLFEEWLSQKLETKPHDHVGFAESPTSCPIAQYLTEHDIYPVWIKFGTVIWEDIPEWAREFVGMVDETYDSAIFPQNAKDILERIKWAKAILERQEHE